MHQFNLITLTSLILTLSTAGYSDTFDIGGKSISIPDPQGFVRVTKEMPRLYKNLHYDTEKHAMLALYIPQSFEESARLDMPISLKNYFELKINHQAIDHEHSYESFAEFAEEQKSENAKMLKFVRGLLKELNIPTQNRNGSLNVKAILQFTDFLPFEAHFETPQILSYSTIFKHGPKKQSERPVAVKTVAYANLDGRVLIMDAMAYDQDVSWTQTRMKAWATATALQNTPPVSDPSHKTQAEKYRERKDEERREAARTRRIVYIILGGILTLASAIYSASQKRRESRRKAKKMERFPQRRTAAEIIEDHNKKKYSSPPPIPPAHPTEEQFVAFNCPTCEFPLVVDKEHMDQAIFCPECKSVIEFES